MSRVIAVSNFVREDLIKHGIPADRSEVRYLTADEERFKPAPFAPAEWASRYSIAPDELMMSSVTLFRPFKSPELLFKTLFDELGQVILHTDKGDFAADETKPSSLCEVGGEFVALLCCESLSLEGADYARGYIQHWLNRGSGSTEEAIQEKSAQKICRAADQIHRAETHRVRGVTLNKRTKIVPVSIGRHSC